MSIPERSQELIQKYLDLAASETELAELEQLLIADAEVAQAFAEAARLHASLDGYFRKQYKIDQVASLLDAPDAPAPPAGQANGTAGPQAHADVPAEQQSPRRSTFTPRYKGLTRPRPGAIVRNWKSVAAAALVLVMGISVWVAKNAGGNGPRLVAGRVTVAGRDVNRIPDNASFEVVGREPAVIELPGGARIEFAAATRCAIGRDKDLFVLKLESGGGDFHVEPGQPSFRVETRLGEVTTSGGRFSLDLITKLPDQVSPTATESIQLPRLVVIVALGSATVRQAGISTTLSAGEERVFL